LARDFNAIFQPLDIAEVQAGGRFVEEIAG
jgi:hypothetical protein